MNIARLALRYAMHRPLGALLNTLLLALGVATISVVSLVSQQMTQRLERDARDIDLVVGAKGSPVQLILSGIFHLDAPTGNVPLADIEALAKNRLVREAIPLALGDSYRGFRIVGAPHAYLALYEGRLAAGRLYGRSMEAVLGAEVARRTGARVGQTIIGVHGIDVEDETGDAHAEQPYTVVGVLAPAGSVLDRLVLTPIESVWDVHAVHHEGKPAPPPEVTVALVRYASPLAAATLPRLINATPSLQAASPAFETARLMAVLGAGLEVLRAFGLVLVAAAALGFFIALYNALRERRYDLAVLRALGASPATLFALVLVEALVLSLAGLAAGLVLGHAATELIGAWLRAERQPEVTGLAWAPEETWLVLAVPLAAVVAALVPSWLARRTSPATVLAER